MLSRRAVIAAAAALPFASGCATSPPFRIGYQRNGLLLAAKARGDLEAALKGRVTVDWTEFPSGPPLLEAMSLGTIDFGGSGDTPPIFAQAAGAKIVYVAAQPVSGAAAAIIVPPNSTLRSVADLRGRRFAYTRGSSAQNFVRAALDEGGLTLADVDAINLTPTQAAQAFAARAIDAWAIWDPFLAHAEVEEQARVLVAGRGLARSNSFLLANSGVATTHADLITATLDTLAATAAWAAAHRDGLAALIAAATEVDPAVAARIAARQDFAVEPLTPAIAAEQQRIADALRDQAQLPGSVTVTATMWHGWTPRRNPSGR
jgi:sulfonate transport system substrate-binding protein